MRGQGRKGEAQEQRDKIMAMREFLSGEEFTQSQVCTRLAIKVSTASIRLRELHQDGLVARKEYPLENCKSGVSVRWVKRRSTQSYLSKSWRKISNQKLGICPERLGFYPQ